MKILYGDAWVSDEITEWVAKRIPHLGPYGFNGRTVALGVIGDGGEPLAGVVFHDWQEQFGTIQLSMAAASPRWATRSIVRQLLSYPFLQVRVRKVWTVTPAKNVRAIRFNKGIGFKQEAVLARHFGDDHAVVCRMFDHDYKRLYLDRIERKAA